MEKNHKVTFKLVSNFPVLFLEGDITSEADDDIMKHYHAIKEKHSPFYVIIDFNKMKYINSAGIATLINIIQDLEDFGGKIVFTNLTQHFQKVMDIVGITDFVHIFATTEDAINNISSKA